MGGPTLLLLRYTHDWPHFAICSCRLVVLTLDSQDLQILVSTACMHVQNLAASPHLDVSVCPCQPSWRTFSSQTSPSGTTFPMGGVLSMCPPHPLFVFQLLHIHAHPLQPTQPPPGLCAHLHTLPPTSAHLAHHFFLGFPYTHSTSCALAHFHLYPMAYG